MENQFLTGIMEFKPVEYWVETKIIKRKFWFDKIEHYVHSEFMKLGPFGSWDEAFACKIRLEHAC